MQQNACNKYFEKSSNPFAFAQPQSDFGSLIGLAIIAHMLVVIAFEGKCVGLLAFPKWEGLLVFTAFFGYN